MREIVLVLPNIRSVLNVGSIFRTANATGVCHIYLVGYTPTPIDRFGRKRRDFAKSALGAEQTIEWSSHDDIASVVQDLRQQGFGLVAVEQSQQSIDYRAMPTTGKLALIVGNEVDGIEPDLLALCDQVVEIPMYGSKESLNVAVTAGIVLYEARRGD